MPLRLLTKMYTRIGGVGRAEARFHWWRRPHEQTRQVKEVWLVFCGVVIVFTRKRAEEAWNRLFLLTGAPTPRLMGGRIPVLICFFFAKRPETGAWHGEEQTWCGSHLFTNQGLHKFLALAAVGSKRARYISRVGSGKSRDRRRICFFDGFETILLLGTFKLPLARTETEMRNEIERGELRIRHPFSQARCSRLWRRQGCLVAGIP